MADMTARGLAAKSGIKYLWGTGLNRWLYAVSQAKRYGNDLNIVCALDSLTAGASGSSYLNFFRSRLQNSLGDGGMGFVPFNTSVLVAEGGTFGISGGTQKTNSTFDAATNDKYDPTLYSSRFTTSGYININPNKIFRKADVFYLKKPSGGTFKWGDTGNVPGQNTIDTSNATTMLGTTTYTGTWPAVTTNGAQASSITGDVHLIGANLRRNDVGGGIRVHRFAQGGTQTRQVAQLDGDTYTAFVKSLGCDLFIINGGMNDSAIPVTPEQYDSDIRTILSWVRVANPNAAIILKIMNESDGVNGRNNVLETYRLKMLKIALDFDALIFDVRWVLGSYPMATAKGLMADGVHPNGAANRLIGEALYKFIGGDFLKNVDSLLLN